MQIDDNVGDILKHPALKGFARLTLPWDDGDYDESLRIDKIGALFPYHSHVNPRVVVSSLNRLIDDASARHTVFYDMYSGAEKQADRALNHTGLFFFRGRPNAPFALIAPGGGFSYVATLHEGFPYAVEINKRGYNAFVIKYRARQGGLAATRDMAAALSYIVEHAEPLGVTATGYSLWGSSAGARMAASIGSHGTERFGRPSLPAPASVILLYTGHSDVARTEPPTFVVSGDEDGIASSATMERRVAALRRIGTDVEYRKYPGVGHGFGLGVGTSAEGWIDDAIGFWTKHLRRVVA